MYVLTGKWQQANSVMDAMITFGTHAQRGLQYHVTALGGFIVSSPWRPLSAFLILGDSYEGVMCPSGWSAEGLFGSARRRHVARLTEALLWFDVDAMTPSLFALPTDLMTSLAIYTRPFTHNLIQRLDRDMEL